MFIYGDVLSRTDILLHYDILIKNLSLQISSRLGLQCSGI